MSEQYENRGKRMILLLLLASTLHGQSFEVAMAPSWVALSAMAQPAPPAITPTAGLHFSYSLQPLEALRTVAGRRVKGLALALVTTCSDAPVPVRLSPDRITQYLQEQRVEPVMAALALSTLDHASSTSTLEIAVQVATFVGQAASVLMAGGTIAANAGIKVGTLLATQGAAQLRPKVERRAADAAIIAKWQIDGPDIDMQPGQCISRAPLVRWPVKGKGK